MNECRPVPYQHRYCKVRCVVLGHLEGTMSGPDIKVGSGRLLQAKHYLWRKPARESKIFVEPEQLGFGSNSEPSI